MSSVFFLALTIYPFVVGFLLDRVGAGALVAVLVLLLMARHIQLLRRYFWLAAATVTAALLFSSLPQFDSELLLRFYPTGISIFLLGVFSISLLRPPAFPERIAASTGIKITPAIRRYLIKVTVVWCVFFVFNALVSGYLAFAGSMTAWTLYNGFVSYVFVGILFFGEYMVRRRFIASQPEVEADQLSRFPEVLSHSKSDKEARYGLRVPANLIWFTGHFPGKPILPGVVQIDWAIHYARQSGLLVGEVTGLPRVKFSAIIEPNSELQLILRSAAPGLRFRIESASGLHSEGSVTYA